MAWYLNRNTGVKFDLPDAIVELIQNDRHQQYNFEPCEPPEGVAETKSPRASEGETASDLDVDDSITDPVSDTNKVRRGRKTS